jgi:hypothetical protein
MAKVKGPLLGRRAHGKLGNQLIFQGWKSETIVRSKVDPTNPNSTAQQVERGLYGQAIEWWREGGLIEYDKEAWQRLAKFKKFPYTTYNYFVKRMLELQIQGAICPFYWEAEAYYHDTTWDYFELKGLDEEVDLGVFIGSSPATMDRFEGATWYGAHYWVRIDDLVEDELNYFQWGNSGGGDMRTGIYTYTRETP